MLSRLFHRVGESYAVAQSAYLERVGSGTQPQYPGLNVEFLVGANTAYLAVTGLLYAAMRNRTKPIDVKGVLMVYNAVCVLLAAYCTVGIAVEKFFEPGAVVCNPLRTDESGQRLAWYFWVFYATKFLEFLDTWFFLLRRSFRQVTFLHLFHHSSITVVVGTIYRYDFSSDMFLPILVNSVVHVLMYAHYFATGVGIKSWWSPYLTSLQLLQFLLITAQSYLAFTAGPSCGAVDFAKVIMMLYMVSMLVLFGHFFLCKYLLNKDAHMCGVIKSVAPARRLVFNGVTSFTKEGEVTVSLPPGSMQPQFTACIQLTAIGSPMPHLHVAKDLCPHTNSFAVKGGSLNGKVSWQVIIEQTPPSLPVKDLKTA